MSEWRDRLAAAIDERGVGRVELTRLAGINHTALRDILDRGVTPRIDTLAKLASALGISLAYLLEGDVSSPVALQLDGYTQGRGMWGEYEPDKAPVVPLNIFNEHTVSLRIEGDEFAPRFHRHDVVIGAKNFGPHLDNLIGEECIVQTADGQRLIGILARGAMVGRFNVKSFDPRQEDVPNVRLAWAAPITMIYRDRH